MPRYKQPIQAGPKLSDDRFDKFIAAMSWYVCRNKADPEFISAPHYYTAVSDWFGLLSLDHQEIVGTVHYVFSTPGRKQPWSTPQCCHPCRRRPRRSGRHGAIIDDRDVWA